MTGLVLAATLAAGALPPQSPSWTPDGLTVVVAAPGRVTDIVLERGERLAAANPVAAGDTARWIIGQTESGAGASRQVHVLVKPIEAGLATNLIILTERRTYRLELRSSSGSWAPVISWRYPAGALIALAKAEGGPPAPPPLRAAAAPAFDPAVLNFGWRVEGRARFRPLRVFDDGRRTYVDLPHMKGEVPLLFVVTDRGVREAAPVKVKGSRLVADLVPDRAELRLGKAHVALVREVRP